MQRCYQVLNYSLALSVKTRKTHDYIGGIGVKTDDVLAKTKQNHFLQLSHDGEKITNADTLFNGSLFTDFGFRLYQMINTQQNSHNWKTQSHYSEVKHGKNK